MSKTPADRTTLERAYQTARHNMLLIVVFTAVNMLFAAVNGDFYFLFSAYVPYTLIVWGMLLCGFYPAEYYAGDLAIERFLSPVFLIACVVIALAILAMYLLAWLFAKKHRVGWLIAPLVFFVIDTGLMFWLSGFRVNSVPDILFHVWVIVSLCLGIRAHFKLAKLPPEEIPVPTDQEQTEDSRPLRSADLDAKAKIFLEISTLGHTIIYRRVKRVNELVVDGAVYGEYEALVEFPHRLSARLDGHRIEAGTDETSHLFINVDGQTVASKRRWI